MAKRISQAQTVSLVSITQALLVADYLSFRQAASALGIRPSAVSRRVRSLEDLLGVSLFERHHTGVRVTGAGGRFFHEAREVLAQLDHAVRTAGAAGRGAIGRLSIGIWSSIATGFLRELIRVYSQRHRDVVVALPQGHPLAAKKEVEWRDLGKEHFIIRRSELDPELCRRVTERLTHRDYHPSVQKLDVGRETLMHLVALGLGVSLTGEAAIATQFAEVEFRPIAGGDDVLQFSAVWSPDNDNPALRRFLSLARALAKKKKRLGTTGGHSSPHGITFSFAFLGALARKLGLSP